MRIDKKISKFTVIVSVLLLVVSISVFIYITYACFVETKTINASKIFDTDIYTDVLAENK